MKILVVSDSHGNIENMCRAVERERPDMALHLGDGWRDAELLALQYPGLPIEKVPGNCDFRDEPPVLVTSIRGKRVMLCHGHTLGVRSGLDRLLYAALEQEADVVLFGHTHQPFVDIRKGIVMLNPGSIGSGGRHTYGTLTFRDGVCVPAAYVLE